MHETLLRRILNAVIPNKRVFLGVFAANELPNFRRERGYPACFVANTDPSDEGGEHWVAFYFDERRKGHYFDSFAKQIPYKSWQTYLHKNSPGGVVKQRDKLQSLKSEACGHFCIFYLFNRNISVLSLSDEELMKNVTDSKAVAFVNKIKRSLNKK